MRKTDRFGGKLRQYCRSLNLAPAPSLGSVGASIILARKFQKLLAGNIIGRRFGFLTKLCGPRPVAARLRLIPWLHRSDKQLTRPYGLPNLRNIDQRHSLLVRSRLSREEAPKRPATYCKRAAAAEISN